MKPNGKVVATNGLSTDPENVKSEDVKAETSVVVKPEKVDPKVSTKHVVVNVERMNVRKEPSMKADVLKIVSKGAEFKYLDKINEFVKIELDDKSVGYAKSDLVTVKE